MTAQDLKNSILQLAVQGKLVQQYPEDGTATDLLKHIAQKKSDLIKDRALKKEKPLPAVDANNLPFDVPENWVWIRLGDFCSIYNGNSINAGEKAEKYSKKCDGHSFIATKDVGFDHSINYENGVYIPLNREDFRIAPVGSVLLCMEGGSAGRKIGILEQDVCFGNKLCCLAPFVIFNKYLYYFLQSPAFFSAFTDLMTGIIGGVGAAKIKSIAITEDRLKGYYRKVFECASQKDSLQYIFTITNVYEQYCLLEERHIYKFHLQEAFQRVQMDLRPRNEFAVFIMDELNTETIKQIKAVCHEFTVNGDFIRNYGNVYHSILTESSNQSAGIQLADYAVGAMYGYLRRSFIAPDNYAFATDMYNDYIYRKLRHSAMGSIMGYGIREVPKHSTLRQNLAALFPDIQVDTAT